MPASACRAAFEQMQDHDDRRFRGDAVLEVLSDNNIMVPVKRIGVRDTFAETGSLEELYAKYGLSAEHIQSAVKSLLK